MCENKVEIYVCRKTGGVDKLNVPCGKCVHCLISHSRQWALRCCLEAKLHEKISVITLTYDDLFLPENGSLRRRDLQLFLKRLRKRHPFRYFGCGEYGAINGRPHYHVVIFGYDFPDRKFLKWSKRSGKVYCSSELSRLWTAGFATVGDFSPDSAFYTSKYLSKVKTANMDMRGKDQPFLCMSLKPSIGYSALTYEDFQRGYIYLNGEQWFLPRSFYLSLERRTGEVFPDLVNKRSDMVLQSEARRADPYRDAFFAWKQGQDIIKGLRY